MGAAAYSAPIVNTALPPSAPAGPWAQALVALGTALAYAAVGALALLLAGPPGYASPLYPSAGIALAAVLTYGRAALPGVMLGAFAVNAGLGLIRHQSGLDLVLLPFLIACGAMLQAGVGAWLVRRFVGPAVVLNAPRDIARAGFLGGLLACTISPSMATPALWAMGAIPASAAIANWLTWWSGDALGVLIAAPLVLTVIGQPAADWRPRRRTLGAPLLLAVCLLAVAVFETGRLDRERQHAVFERVATRLADAAQSRLGTAQHALQALHGAARIASDMDRNSLRTASRWWLAQPIQLQATGYGVRLPNQQVPAFEAGARAEGERAFQVFDRDGGSARAQSGEVVVLRYIEPELGNAAAQGLNALSVPAARAAITATRQSGEPAATSVFELTQSSNHEIGLVLYQALYQTLQGHQPATAADRQAQFSGVVFVTLRTEDAMAGLATPAESFMRWCLVDDAAPSTVARHVAGPAGCESAVLAAGHFGLDRQLPFGGRNFTLRLRADPATLPGSQRAAGWLLSLSGMAAAAMLGALLLTVTGHSRRTELAVRAGTQELRGQVGERLQAEAALRESGERLRSILDNVPLGIIFLDPQGHLIECNTRFCDMTGQPAPALLGRSVAEMVHGDDAAAIRRMRRELLRGRRPGPLEAVRLHVSNGISAGASAGHEITVRVSASALRGANGDMVRMVGVVEDITEHLRLEASEKALQRAEAANLAKNEFLSRMSHELRTPLNAMLGFAQLLGLDRDPGLLPHQREWTQQIQRAGWHLLEMINDTLDLARIESGSVQLNLMPVAVQPLVAACQAMVAALATQRQVSFIDRLDEDGSAGVTVLADSTRLKQVLTNLLSNAVKYNREGGSVTVSARRVAVLAGVTGQAGPMVEIIVADTGLGMTTAQQAALFQPYNRLGREQSSIEGTGIGLVISRLLAERMGGTLEARSLQGLGSTFTLRLPAAARAEPAAVRYTDTSPAPYQQRLVHYVEDNETNIEVMRGVFAQRAQIRLETSTLGLDGLAAIRNTQPDLVLLDMQLPDISGLELLRHMKQDDSVASIPVVVVSADATLQQTQNALTSGALHYVTKPLNVARFLQIVDEIMEATDTRWG